MDGPEVRPEDESGVIVGRGQGTLSSNETQNQTPSRYDCETRMCFSWARWEGMTLEKSTEENPGDPSYLFVSE